MKNDEKKVYKESFLGEPSIDKKALEEENKRFLDNDTKSNEKLNILFNKVMRIEKSIYFLITIVTILFIVVLIFLFK